MPVEYKHSENGYLIDVVFGGHYIKFLDSNGLFFSKTGRRTLNGELIKGIIEHDLKRQVFLTNSRWFMKGENKFQQLKAEST